jgi:Lrp/AsnC family transcriptional regulator, leucine-responsive regulatory protein
MGLNKEMFINTWIFSTSIMDDIDRNILDELSKDSSRNMDKLAKYLSIPRSTLHSRIKKLEKTGLIKGYKAILDYEKTDQGLSAFINISLTEKAYFKEILAGLCKNPKIEAVYTVTGRTDIIAKVRFKNAKDMATFTYASEGDGMRTTTGVSRSETFVVLHTLKEYWEIDPSDILTDFFPKKTKKEKSK